MASIVSMNFYLKYYDDFLKVCIIMILGGTFKSFLSRAIMSPVKILWIISYSGESYPLNLLRDFLHKSVTLEYP